MQKILPPTLCPSCKSDLEWKKDQLFCTNLNCVSKNLKKVEHFVKVMKIKGLGPSTISKLDIQNFNDIYELSFDSMEQILGSKIATKLTKEIENSKTASLNEVLPSLGIPLIGKTASTKVCSEISHIDEITEEICKKAGLGPIATNNLIDWLDNNWEIIESLPFSFKTDNKPINSNTAGVVCISGRLKSFKTKALAKTALEEAGFKVIDNLTKEVTILVNESGIESSKTKKAQTMGININNNINELIG